MLPRTALILLASTVSAELLTAVTEIIPISPVVTPGKVSGLDKCPTAETYYTAKDGSIYAICKKTDYEGETAKVEHVESAEYCAELCSKTTGCKQAVFEKNGDCHIKNKDLKLVKNNKYNSIRFVAKPEMGSVITVCPTPEKTTTIYGVTYATCDNTVYDGETKIDIQGTKNIDDCAAACAKYSGCKNSVFLKASSECFLKTGSKPQVWKYDLEYSSSRTTKIPDNGSKLTSCPKPGPGSVKSGSKKYTTCINGDWQSNSLDIIGNVNSAQECADVCAKRDRCVKTSWDSAYNACHIKGRSVFVFNQGFTSLEAVALKLRAARALLNL
ncbi:hypothetical protein NX059_009963 [Plenodomus lindquistii]|nr:hypothetical protein NX059_009963 [Plenodomus lindquistii]